LAPVGRRGLPEGGGAAKISSSSKFITYHIFVA
jgi:hypothetical protein